MNDRTYKPTVLHTSVDGIRYLCGNKKSGSWHEKWMSDKFARSLPLCEDCEELKVAKKKEMSRRMAGGDRVGKSPDMERPAPIPNNRIVVSDYRRGA